MMHGLGRKQPSETVADVTEDIPGFEMPDTIYQKDQHLPPQPDALHEGEGESQETGKVPIRKAAGIFAIMNVLILFVVFIFVVWGMVLIDESVILTDAQYTTIGLSYMLVYGLLITSLVLHIIGIGQSRKAGISIVGHVLGIIGSVISMLTLLILSPVSIILFIFAASFILLNKG